MKRKRSVSDRSLAFALTAAFALLAPLSADAYVGPGAGFAFLSSFLVILIAFFSSLFSLVSWPIRSLYWAFRRRKVLTRAKVKRLVIVGLDGMDPELAARYMDEGKLPHFARLREQGTFEKLQTTYPPISPVAWSTFLTGVNPGQHNIYDFLARQPGTYFPYLSSAQIRGPRRSLRLGKYVIPLGKPQTQLLRKSKPFWHYLGEAGIFCSILRVPITFPPEKSRCVLLSGMCVPDLLGSQGTFFAYSSRQQGPESRQGGRQIPLIKNGNSFTAYVPGPESPARQNGSAESRVPFGVRPTAKEDEVEIHVDSQRFRLRKGEYSDWVPLKFKVAPAMSVHGICRFLLTETKPDLELYLTPVNIDPGKPALPISHPLTYSIYLAKLLGPFATLGLAEDTWALNERVLDDNTFLQQCYLNHDERERMFFDALEKTRQGVCVCVFDTTDRVQHMFWRYLEPGHPANRGGNNSSGAGVIEDLYRRMDDLVGRTLARLGDDALLLVLSDHGFKSFRRGVNLNTWLRRNGYLTLKDGAQEGGDWFKDVDWSRTRAYALGLNGIYINQRVREPGGIVEPGPAKEELKKELRQKLRGLRDPETNQVAIPDVFDARAVFAGPYVGNAPDLVVGYNPGSRTAWESVTGTVAANVFADNTRAWSGDHCIDPRQVPGVLFSNRKIDCEQPAIVDVAPTVLDLFGLKPPAYMNGVAWGVAAKGEKT